MRPVRVCLDARQPGTGQAGGVEQFIIGLAYGLSRLADGEEEYLFLAREDAHTWLVPHLKGSCRLFLAGRAAARPGRLRRMLYGVFPETDPFHTRYDPFAGPLTPRLQRSLGVVEGAGVDLMHFTFQSAFLTAIPSIYHPHDLQHLHLPRYFSEKTRIAREAEYRSYCEQARMVAVSSSWMRRDLIDTYGLGEDKVRVVPLAPLLGAYTPPGPQDLEAARQRLSLPDAFLFYPAATWPHKNHIGLLEALTILRDTNGLHVTAVFTGAATAHFAEIRRRAAALDLADRVRFLGYVDTLDLQCLYRLCRCVVVPTLFEAASFPLWEAFLAGAPAACSRVTSLPEQAGDAALVFDPEDPREIAGAIAKLWTDEELRDRLAKRGARNVAAFSWDRTARTFRAHYRRLAGRPLSSEDHDLIEAAPPM